MVSDIKLDNNNNFIMASNNDISVYTGNDVNILALRNELNANKQWFIDNRLDFNTANKFILGKIFELQLTAYNIALDTKKYAEGTLALTYELTNIATGE